MEPRPILLYDGDCGFCKRWVIWCMDRGAEVEFRPCQEAKTLRAAFGIPESRCKETAIYLDGERVRTHQDAIHAVLARIPGGRGAGWRALGWAGRIPGLHGFAGLGYRIVAKNRHRFRGPK